MTLDFPLDQFLNASAAGSRFENESTSVISCDASPLPFTSGTVILYPAAFAASSIARLPAITIVSARLAPCHPMQLFLIYLIVVLTSLSGSFASQSFCGERDILAPFAPPLKSEVLKVLALSHATVTTLSEIDNPELEIFCLYIILIIVFISRWNWILPN